MNDQLNTAIKNCISEACVRCPAFELGICNAALGAISSDLTHNQTNVHAISARRNICRERQTAESVTVICHGWAFTAANLTDGRQQIFSFALPGDIASVSSVFDPVSTRTIEALTEVHYRTFSAAAFKDALRRDFVFSEKFFTLLVDNLKSSDRLAFDLGRRSADERIARLILNLFERLIQRGLVEDQTMEFPLRQYHIADATGLTPIHVNRVMTIFRRIGLIEISDRSLKIVDLPRLQEVANPR